MFFPKQIPAMTLKDVVLFPEAIMPLRIFEKRYQMMLSDVIKGERMIAIVAQRDSHPDDGLNEEPPFEVGTVGLIRVSKKQTDGTSLVMLQGISRFRIKSIETESPYRVLNVHPLETIVDSKKTIPRDDILKAMHQNYKLGGIVTREILDYLSDVKEDSRLIDLIAYTVCHHTIRKQAMLEVQRLHKRAEMLLQDLLTKNMQLSIERNFLASDTGKDGQRN
jgi:Lon protease-like protein